jgi:holo-[acyl-carrier protein] synthase
MVVLKHDRITGVKGIGIDITPIPKIARIIDGCDRLRHHPKSDREILTSLFTPSEIDRCQSASNPHQFYAVCFATKEAVGKALGTGLAGIEWNEIEANISLEKLTVHLHGEARLQAKRRGVSRWLATWCHWDNHVLVHVLAQ